MKNIIIFLCLLLFSPATRGEYIRSYALTYNEKDFSLIRENDETFIIPTIDSYCYASDPHTPALPVFQIYIMIGPNEKYVSTSMRCSEILIGENIKICHNLEDLPTSRDEKMYEPVAYSDSVYPSLNFQYTGTHELDGYKFISLLVCPFKYDVAQNNSLKLLTDIELNIRLLNDDNHKSFETKKALPSILKDLVRNSDEIESLYPSANFMVKSSFPQDNPYSYLIITNDSLQPIYQKLADWKTIKGVRTKILTTNYIDSIFTGNTIQQKIKEAIYDQYEADDQQLEYVLLGGDVDIVPAQMCYISASGHTNETPCDWYYACLGKMNWDSNGNGIYGEVSDDVNLAPNVAIARIPISSVSQTCSFINRIIEYETNPRQEAWTNTMLLCGTYLTSITNGISDTQRLCDNLFANSIQPYWSGNKFRLYDTSTDYPQGANYEVSAEHFQNELEKGYSFVYESTHGGVDSLRFRDTYKYFYLGNDARALNNSGYTVFSTLACSTNAFDYYHDCLSEAFIKNPNSGVIAYTGSSREGWTVTSPEFDNAFYKALFSSKDKRFGPAVKNAKISKLSNTTYYGPRRWLQFTLNPIGDPELPLYVDTPIPFDSVALSLSNTAINIQTGTEDCTICIMSLEDKGNCYYSVIDSVSSLSIDLPSQPISICITKTGYIPYTIIYGDSVFIQNKTIAQNYHVISNNTMIGSHVISNEEQGPVIQERGKLEIKSAQGTVIEGIFEVKQGAELLITPNI